MRGFIWVNNCKHENPLDLRSGRLGGKTHRERAAGICALPPLESQTHLYQRYRMGYKMDGTVSDQSNVRWEDADLSLNAFRILSTSI